jgi:hypothetical protein
VFDTEKRVVVMKKQMGASSDDLWIAYWPAGRGGVASPDDILQARHGKGTWREVFAALGLTDRELGARFSTSLKTDPSPPLLAEIVVDDLLVKRKLLRENELTSLRKAGGTNQELILVALIAAKIRQPAIQLYHEVKLGTRSWGSLLERAQLKPGEIQNTFVSLVNRSK